MTDKLAKKQRPVNTLYSKVIKYKKRFLVGAIALIMVTVAILNLIPKDSTRQPTISIPAVEENKENSIVVESEPAGVEMVVSNCEVSVRMTPFSCQLKDIAKGGVVEAPPLYTHEGKRYVFTTWEGCIESDTNKRLCNVEAQNGGSGKIKAFYRDESISQNNTKPGEPHLELKLAGFSSVHFPGDMPLIPSTTKTIQKTLEIVTKNIDMQTCNIVHETILDDDGSAKSETLQAKPSQQVTLYDGTYVVRAVCKMDGKDYATTIKGRVADRQPKLCRGFGFIEGVSSVSDVEELKTHIVGRWEGCVTTPWVPAYFVSLDFMSDGTYRAVTQEVLDGMAMNAMYYGTQDPSPNKKYYLDYFGDGHGTGQIDIVFNSGVNRGSLKNIRLSANNSQLSFEFFHRNQYGPLLFQLNKK